MARTTVITVRVKLPNNWKPRPDQMKLWAHLENGGTRAVEVAHRRWGKDDVALHFTATATQMRVGNYWHMLPEYAQARKAVWEAVNPKTGKRRIDEAFPEQLRASTREHEMIIKFKNNSTWQLVGSDNFNALVGSPPIGVVFSEYSLSNPLAWGHIRPILAENGGWAIFIYTARGNNHGKRLYDFAKNDPNWFAEKITADQSPVFSKETLEQERREMIADLGEEEGEALYQQEYFCSFEGAVFGSYYGKQIADAHAENRITVVPYLVGHEVYTFWDLGIDDSMSIWFMQAVGNELRFIDYYENTGYGLDHYAKVLQNKHYIYGDHYMPHDAAHNSVQTGMTTKDFAEKLGIKPVIVVPRARDTQAVIAGIQACRKVFNQCSFDAKKCARGIAALEGYRADYDEVKKKLGNHPLHDWCSHGADSFRTFGVGFQAKVKIKDVSSLLNGMQMGMM